MAAVEEVSGECKEGRVGLGQRTSWDCARPLKGLFWVGAFSLEGEGNGGQALHMPMHPFRAHYTARLRRQSSPARGISSIQ
jgi:hypothetical protein